MPNFYNLHAFLLITVASSELPKKKLFCINNIL